MQSSALTRIALSYVKWVVGELNENQCHFIYKAIEAIGIGPPL